MMSWGLPMHGQRKTGLLQCRVSSFLLCECLFCGRGQQEVPRGRSQRGSSDCFAGGGQGFLFMISLQHADNTIKCRRKQSRSPRCRIRFALVNQTLLITSNNLRRKRGREKNNAGATIRTARSGFNGAPFSYRNRTPHLSEFFLLRFVIWLLRAYKYRQLRP